MGRTLAIYAATLLTVAVLDFFWLGFVAKSWYQDAIGHLMAPKPNLWGAAAFYLLYPVGIVVFAVQPAGDWTRAALLGALFGVFCYGTYDATNFAIMKDWPLAITLVDVAWGAFASACGAVAGALAARALA